MEQPRRKRESNVAANRRINALKQHGHHPHFGGAKIGELLVDVFARKDSYLFT